MSGWVAGAAIVAAVIGAGVGVSGQLQQASAQKAAADYQSKVAASNAATALQNAEFTAASGEQQAAIQQQKTRAEVGAELSAEASSGVDVNSETSSNVLKSTDELGRLDAQTIRSNAARQAYGYETQSTNFGNQSSADLSQGANAETAGEFNSGGSILSGAGSAAMNYAKVTNNASGLSNGNDLTTANNESAYTLNNAGGGSNAYNQIANSSEF